MKALTYILVLLVSAYMAGCTTAPKPSDWDGQLTVNNPVPAECKEYYRAPPKLKAKSFSRGEAAIAYNRLYKHDISEGQRADGCRVWAKAQGS